MCVCVYAEGFAENVLSFLTKIATAQKFISSTEWSAYTMCTRDHNNAFMFRTSEFQDNTAKFYCRVYYAEQFRKLRKLIFPAGEKR